MSPTNMELNKDRWHTISYDHLDSIQQMYS
uniref:Uncharacterized protein n=1 Tax=Arundo donax TaxID=35708 RepID=A0A0A8XUT1_ARUDO